MSSDYPPAKRSDKRTPFEVKVRLEPFESHELIKELERRGAMPTALCDCCADDECDGLAGQSLHSIRSLIMAGEVEEAIVQLGRADEALEGLPFAFERFLRARKG